MSTYFLLQYVSISRVRISIWMAWIKILGRIWSNENSYLKTLKNIKIYLLICMQIVDMKGEDLNIMENWPKKLIVFDQM